MLNVDISLNVKCQGSRDHDMLLLDIVTASFIPTAPWQMMMRTVSVLHARVKPRVILLMHCYKLQPTRHIINKQEHVNGLNIHLYNTVCSNRDKWTQISVWHYIFIILIQFQPALIARDVRNITIRLTGILKVWHPTGVPLESPILVTPMGIS